MKGPIRYYGGKSGMIKVLLNLIPEHNRYIEVFGGGASLLFAKEPGKVEIYNDLYENVYALFKVLTCSNLYYEFKRKLDLTYYSRRLREEFKKELLRPDLTYLQRAFYFFYVNRSSVNGTGGFSTHSYTRRNMCKAVSDYLSCIDRLDELHQRLSRCIIENLDFTEIFKKYDKEETFMYLDPPYHPETRTPVKYPVDMSSERHVELVQILLRCKSKILLSGYINSEYELLTNNGWIREDFNVKTITGKFTPKTKIESLWRNY